MNTEKPNKRKIIRSGIAVGSTLAAGAVMLQRYLDGGSSVGGNNIEGFDDTCTPEHLRYLGENPCPNDLRWPRSEEPYKDPGFPANPIRPEKSDMTTVEIEVVIVSILVLALGAWLANKKGQQQHA